MIMFILPDIMFFPTRSPKYRVVVTRDSDEERLLVRSATYRELLYRVDSLEEGLQYAKLHSDAVVVTDAAVADYIAERVRIKEN